MKTLTAALFFLASRIAMAELNTLTSEEKSQGFRLLFDGQSLENFRNYKEEKPHKLWQVKDGAIVLTAKGGGNLMTKEQFGDFEFRFDFLISADGNSGIMWRVSEDGGAHPFFTGPEFQILGPDSNETYPHEIKAGNVSGAFYGFVTAKPELTKPAGEWNSGIIRVEGTKIKLTLNGVVTAELDAASEEYKIKLTASKFALWPRFNKNAKGHLVFQDHADVVSFRNLRVKEL